MIIEKITKFLESNKDRVFDGSTLEWALDQFEGLVRRRFMEPEKQKSGRVFATLITVPCARRGAYRYHGIAEDYLPLARTYLNWFVGDQIELSLLALAKLSGCDISTPQEILRKNERMTVSWGGMTIGCWPDGIVHANNTYLNVEIKAMNARVWDRAYRSREIDNTWGYRSQCSLEVAAWRGNGFNVPATCLLGVNKLNGRIGEWILPFDERLVAEAFARAKAIAASDPDHLPNRGYDLVDAGDGKKKKMGLVCGLCPHHRKCWSGIGTVSTVMVKGRPVFHVTVPQGDTDPTPLALTDVPC